MTAKLTVNSGTTKSWTCTWTDAGGPINLTGYTLDIVDVTDTLAPHLSHAIKNAAAGESEIVLTWDPSLIEGFYYEFRLRIRPGAGGAETTQEIQLEIE